MTDGNRRNFLKNIGIFSLVTLAAQQRAFGLNFRSEGADWAAEMRKISDELLHRKISQAQWQAGVTRIFSETNFPRMLRGLDFEALRKGMEIQDNGGTWQNIFIKSLSQNKPKEIHTKIVGLRKGRTVPPHGHENEVSSFLTLGGEFHLRQYDRVAMRAESLDIVSAFNGKSKPGDWSSQSEEKSNVHWLTTESDEGFFLSIRVAKIDGSASGRERIPIDPDGARDLGNGIFRASVMDKDAWWKKYSRT